MQRLHSFYIETDYHRLEYEFIGCDVGDTPVPTSDIQIKLFEKPPKLLKVNFTKLLWEKTYKNKSTPDEQQYYTFKFGTILNDNILIVIENELIKLNISDGSIIWNKSFGNTNILAVYPYEKNILVLYYFRNFDLSIHVGNFKKVDLNGNVMWTATPLDKEWHRYFHFIRTEGGIIEAWAGSMHMIIDKESGVITESSFVK